MENKGYLIDEVGSLGGNDKGEIKFILFLMSLTLILTVNYFDSRDVTKFNELDAVINGIFNFNIMAILVVLLNIGMIVVSTISIIKLSKYKK